MESFRRILLDRPLLIWNHNGENFRILDQIRLGLHTISLIIEDTARILAPLDSPRSPDEFSVK
jgi:hypothetical protein